MSTDDASYARLGATLRFPGLPGSPAFIVVGHAVSVNRTADAWVTPTALTAPTGYQMLYRFADAGSDARVATDRSRIAAAAPPGAIAGSRSWLVVKHDADQNTGVFIPFLAAFGILGLAMSVLIVGTLGTGAIGSSIRRIEAHDYRRLACAKGHTGLGPAVAAAASTVSTGARAAQVRT